MYLINPKTKRKVLTKRKVGKNLLKYYASKKNQKGGLAGTPNITTKSTPNIPLDGCANEYDCETVLDYKHMNYCLNFMLNNLNTYTYDGIHEPTQNFDDIKQKLDSKTINSKNIGDIYRKIIFPTMLVINGLSYNMLGNNWEKLWFKSRKYTYPPLPKDQDNIHKLMEICGYVNVADIKFTADKKIDPKQKVYYEVICIRYNEGTCSPSGTIFYYINDDKTINVIICMKGSSSAKDWHIDSQGISIKNKGKSPIYILDDREQSGKCMKPPKTHPGFADYSARWGAVGLRTIQESLSVFREAGLTNSDPNYFFTGHSLGSALTTILSFLFNPTTKGKTVLLTFGGPIIGADSFNELYTYARTKPDAYFRIFNKSDKVTMGLWGSKRLNMYLRLDFYIKLLGQDKKKDKKNPTGCKKDKDLYDEFMKLNYFPVDTDKMTMAEIKKRGEKYSMFKLALNHLQYKFDEECQLYEVTPARAQLRMLQEKKGLIPKTKPKTQKKTQKKSMFTRMKSMF